MDKNTDLISYSEMFQIIHKNRLALIFLLIANILISSLLVFFIPDHYKVSGIYRVPLQGYFGLSGQWVEEPFENIDINIIKFSRQNNTKNEGCDSINLFDSTESSIKKIDSKTFEIVVVGTKLDCTQLKFESLLSFVKQDLNFLEINKTNSQNALLSKDRSSYKLRLPREHFNTLTLAPVYNINIPFSEFSPMSVESVKNDWLKIYKYGFIAQLILSFLYVTRMISKK